MVITMATSFILTTNLVFYLLLPKMIGVNPVTESLTILEHAERIGSFRRFNNAYLLELDENIVELSNTQELAQFFENNPNGLVITRDKYLSEFKFNDSYDVIFRKNDLIDEHDTIILKKSN